MSKKILSLLLCLVLALSTLFVFTGCNGSSDGDGSGSGNNGGNNGSQKDTLVIMTENLDGVFNPFFSTSANDGTIVSMTQIGMLTSKYVNGAVAVAYGENEAVVTLDFEYDYDEDNDETVYTFVIKNGVKFSDGHPLTIEDVLFNLYVYLDPVYTGSNTMYSTDIKGLAAYRTQVLGADNDSQDGDFVSEQAAQRAQDRIATLLQVYQTAGGEVGGGGSVTYYLSVEDMKAAIASANISSGYKNAVATPAEQAGMDFNAQLLADYELALEKFRAELERDFESAKDSYTDAPYDAESVKNYFQDPVFCFMYMEGYVTLEYEKKVDNEGNLTDKDDLSKIKGVKNFGYNDDVITTKEQAIEYVFTDNVESKFHNVITGWATANEMLTEFASKATDVILRENISSDGSLLVPNISGIKSLGHLSESDAAYTDTVTVNGNVYNVAHSHNSDGTPAEADAYDVLQITINGVDPKAHWNFAFTVAPQHYYGEGSSVGMDIANNKFGVEFASFDFMKNVIQSTRNVKLPMGAGAYQVTDRNNSSNPAHNEFYSNGIVYFKASEHFYTVGEGLNNANIKKIQYRVISASNSIAALEKGEVDYITPQLTQKNLEDIEALESQGIKYLQSDQLGYGYIGINAAKVPNLYIRKAIMSAMDTSRAITFYRAGSASQIWWPMSKVSWAYPKGIDGTPSTDNGIGYPQIGGGWDEQTAIKTIEGYMTEAGVTEGDPQLKIEFTIAGSNLMDHPTYATFREAARILNSLGWEVTVTPDTQALTKINSGSLQVWAAAWGSTIDPDMYQVYHKDSKAGSTNAWGYSYIKTNGTTDEKYYLDELSRYIDEARETTDQDERADLYKNAMENLLELAIELPVYQRSVIYVYNSKVLDSSSMPSSVNPYTSPLDRIWELKFA
ncbi:MAG: hypothetical protein IJX38_01935 [Clostridia bacterium]|nr:hypothetical protein [Clostridia bacterium]